MHACPLAQLHSTATHLVSGHVANKQTNLPILLQVSFSYHVCAQQVFLSQTSRANLIVRYLLSFQVKLHVETINPLAKRGNNHLSVIYVQTLLEIFISFQKHSRGNTSKCHAICFFYIKACPFFIFSKHELANYSLCVLGRTKTCPIILLIRNYQTRRIRPDIFCLYHGK